MRTASLRRQAAGGLCYRRVAGSYAGGWLFLIRRVEVIALCRIRWHRLGSRVESTLAPTRRINETT